MTSFLKKLMLLFLLAGISNLYGQEKTYEEMLQEMENEYDSHVKEQDKLFDEYVKSMDDEFAAYLKGSWEEFNLYMGEEVPNDPKPVTTPTVDNTVVKRETSIPVVIPNRNTLAIVNKTPKIPSIQRQEEKKFRRKNLSFDFYGADIELTYDKDFITRLPSKINSNAIAEYWKKMAKTNHYTFINELLSYKNNMNLNDYAFYRLVKKASEKISPRSENVSNLMTWFLMVKARYKIKVGYNSNKIHLLLPSATMLYGKRYYTFSGVKYFLMNSKVQKLYTYKQDYKDAKMILDFNMRKPMILGENYATRNLKFNYQGQTYSFPIKYDKSLIDFFKDYPQADVKVYFDASISAVAKESILEHIRPLIAGKTQIEAANLLIRFVQTAFAYKTDDDQFGYEKFFFPEEIFYYPYSDCEDRAVMFAYLVGELLGLETIGLGYPGHMATAVHFDTKVSGAYFMFKNKKFVVSDATYINASVGMCMPQFANSSAKLIELEDRKSQATHEESIWQIVARAGGNHGGDGKDIVFDDDGNSYVTGFYNQSLKLGISPLTGNANLNSSFIAKFDKNKRLVWVKKASGNGNNSANSISLDKNKQVYIKGIFEGKLSFGSGNVLAENNGGVFVSKFTPDGESLWINKAAVDTVHRNEEFIYVSRFDPYGDRISTLLFDKDETFDSYGISFNSKGICFVSGSYASVAGIGNEDNMMFNSSATVNQTLRWKTENDRFIKQRYNQAIAGIFAFIVSARTSGSTTTGNEIQKAFNKYNPTFRKKSPNIFKSIGALTEIKNVGNVITIRTKGGKTVSFSNMKIADKAKIRVTIYKGGNAQINILSGVTVGKSFINFDLNFVKLLKDTGDLIFDYDDDHTQKRMNLKKDILD